MATLSRRGVDRRVAPASPATITAAEPQEQTSTTTATTTNTTTIERTSTTTAPPTTGINWKTVGKIALGILAVAAIVTIVYFCAPIVVPVIAGLMTS